MSKIPNLKFHYYGIQGSQR
jgi:hypothetical protein